MKQKAHRLTTKTPTLTLLVVFLMIAQPRLPRVEIDYIYRRQTGTLFW